MVVHKKSYIWLFILIGFSDDIFDDEHNVDEGSGTNTEEIEVETTLGELVKNINKKRQ